MVLLNNIIFPSGQGGVALLECLLLAISYVGSLYIKRSPFPRDHRYTIKSRMIGVSFVCLLSPIFLLFVTERNEDLGYSLLQWLGVHSLSVNSIFLPLILTMILFAGPITLLIVQKFLMVPEEEEEDDEDAMKFMDIKWYRTFVVAPFTEEYIFRACMLPILIPNYGVSRSIFYAPLFFGVAHFHHKIEQLKQGFDLSMVILSGVFQMSYTTVFGAYSAFLFVRTGNLVGPVLCHSFCNYMGFPDFQAVPQSKYPIFISFMFVVGLVSFIYLLEPLTNPSLYDSIYYT